MIDLGAPHLTPDGTSRQSGEPGVENLAGRRGIDHARSVSWFRHGNGDPTTRLTATSIGRAALTPDGPGTILVDWSIDHRVQAWGPGARWLSARAEALTGRSRPELDVGDLHPVVTAAARRFGGLRTACSGDLYHELLPAVIAQRITSAEARRQWRLLCHRHGEPAPGPIDGLLLPPRPDVLATLPAWSLHPIGIEAKRADALRNVARVARHLWSWAELAPAEAAAKLRLVRGVGAWTIGTALGPALGDDDAVAVGDYHIPSTVAWALAGEPRGDDTRMLELLEPYRGRRGRVIRLLTMAGHSAPARGPRRRVLPMHRW